MFYPNNYTIEMGGNKTASLKWKREGFKVSLPDINFYCETALPNTNDHFLKFSAYLLHFSSTMHLRNINTYMTVS